MKYPHLFSPIKINSIMVSNRIIANPIGHVYEDKALGRPGVVIAGSVITQPGKSSWASSEEPYAFGKYQVEKTRQRILIAHRGGAKASIEIGHAGQYARVAPGDFAIGPTVFVLLIRKEKNCYCLQILLLLLPELKQGRKSQKAFMELYL